MLRKACFSLIAAAVIGMTGAGALYAQDAKPSQDPAVEKGERPVPDANAGNMGATRSNDQTPNNSGQASGSNKSTEESTSSTDSMNNGSDQSQKSTDKPYKQN